MEVIEIIEPNEEFFAPVSHDVVSSLVSQHDSVWKRMQHIVEMTKDEAAVHYFLESAKENFHHQCVPAVHRIFDLKKAKATLDAAYWSKALNLTDVLDYMPQKRRDDWHEVISKPIEIDPVSREVRQVVPDFNEETVRSSLEHLLSMRSKFFAERVDGIFRSLSKTHLTNQPEGFSKRMILAYLNEGYGYSQAGVINDLRNVIGKFMGRAEIGHATTYNLLPELRKRYGEWVYLDGGTMKIRLYKKGTAHLEVHPDIAYRLNMVLAQLHPHAIPTEFRTKPKKNNKDYWLLQKPLDSHVLNALYKCRSGSNDIYTYTLEDKEIKRQVHEILESLGGVSMKHFFRFDYPINEIIEEICLTGVVPDERSHQYYPTPEVLAKQAVKMAEIESHHSVLEPSAGTGNIAMHLPKDQTKCIEVSELRCQVLEKRGYFVECRDFLKMAPEPVDRIVMNPPYSQGRWQAHTRHAAHSLKPGGILVVILPASARNNFSLPGCTMEWTEPIRGLFKNVGIEVVLLKISKTIE